MIYAAFDEAEVLWGLGDTPEEALSDARLEDARNDPSAIKGELTVFHTEDPEEAEAAQLWGGWGYYILDEQTKTFEADMRGYLASLEGGT